MLKESVRGGRREGKWQMGSYFWDIQRKPQAPEPHISRKTEIMTTERAMAILGLGMKKVRIMVPNGPKNSQIISHGLKFFQMFQNGPKWFQMVSKFSVFQMISNGPNGCLGTLCVLVFTGLCLEPSISFMTFNVSPDRERRDAQTGSS